MKHALTAGLVACMAASPALAGTYTFKIVNNTGEIVTFYQNPPTCVSATCPNVPVLMGVGQTIFLTSTFTGSTPVVDIFPSWYHCHYKQGTCQTYEYDLELYASNPSGTATCPAPVFGYATGVTGPYGSADVNGNGWWAQISHDSACNYTATFTLISQ